MAARKYLFVMSVVGFAAALVWLVVPRFWGGSSYTPPSDASPLFHVFYQHFIDEKGGVYTNLRKDIPKVPGTATSHQMLSESTGLMMLYALKTNDQRLFNQQNAFLDKYLLDRNGLVRWMVDPDDDSLNAHANASIDDLRIISSLIQADAQWGPAGKSSYLAKSNRLASTLLERNVSGGRLTDYYDWKSNEPADTVTISYLDIRTMTRLSDKDARWKSVAGTSRKLLEEAALPNGLFKKTFHWKSAQWGPLEEVHLVDSLYSAYHLAEAGGDITPTLDFIAAQMKNTGKLYGRFLPDGTPYGELESPAVYALAIRIFDLLDPGGTTEALLRERLAAMRVTDPASPYFGAFVQLPSLEGFSFDHLQALLTENNRS
jgi:hypothetical protein